MKTSNILYSLWERDLINCRCYIIIYVTIIDTIFLSINWSIDLPFKSWILFCYLWTANTFPQCKVIMVNNGTHPADTEQPDIYFFTLSLDLIWSQSTPDGNICQQLLHFPLCSSLLSVCVCCLFEQVVYGRIFELFFSCLLLPLWLLWIGNHNNELREKLWKGTARLVDQCLWLWFMWSLSL